MARESKRKRDEKRLGKPERLADMLFTLPWSVAQYEGESSLDMEYLRRKSKAFRSAIERSTVVVADNVWDYVGNSDKGYWDFVKDFPNPLPPFDYMLIETNVVDSAFGSSYQHIGWQFTTFSESELLNPRVRSMFGHWTPQCSHAVVAQMVAKPKESDSIEVLSSGFSYSLEPDGTMSGPPQEMVYGVNPANPKYQEIASAFASLFAPALLAISFMNCKGVTTTSVDPDPATNRERRKAGIKPFLRYHTINIEPMKQVLRTEGGIETNGLKKALHICRGHFKTYKDAFMGRPLDKPLTFWVPSHVKGSSKQGVVVSDYEVNVPIAASLKGATSNA